MIYKLFACDAFQEESMIQVRKANQRGHADHGWLNSHHTFSFASYYDPAHMGFRSMRVMNEDRVAPEQGFGMHPHRDMEIVSCVLSGALAHKDSMGNGEVLRPGEFQRISAGTGISHSEFNPSADDNTHFYQIWLEPIADGLPPSYEQKRFDDQRMNNALRLVASPNGEDGSLVIHKDARIYLSRIDESKSVTLSLLPGRFAWLQVLRGDVAFNDHKLQAGDGVAVSNESSLLVNATSDAEVMIFDLA
jgi:redox-sensitive bicupin YhaK (pirin superfamily)